MQKISSYIYPNRIELLADISGFAVEYKSVYQRNVKIYNGIDNTIEFEIKNADQKRIDLTTLSMIELNIMDVSGQALPNSPYSITPTKLKGIGETTIPEEDLNYLDSPQYLKYSVTAIKDGKEIMLYADAKFGATGTIELVGDALPTIKDPVVHNTFTAEIDLHGNPIWHSSAIPVKFYEAVPQKTVTLEIKVVGFAGTIWVDATTNDTINMTAFRDAGMPFGSWTQNALNGLYTGIIPYATTLPIGDYSYVRVSYQCPSAVGTGATFFVTKYNGTYNVKIKSAGTNYTLGSLIKVVGSQLGGEDGVNDLIIAVSGVAGATQSVSSYAMGSITAVNWSGTAYIDPLLPPPSGLIDMNSLPVDIVTGTNHSGIVESITVL